MMTISRVKYAGKTRLGQQSDVVVHDFGYSPYTLPDVKMIGEDGYVNAGCGFDDSIGALLGTKIWRRLRMLMSGLAGKNHTCIG